MRINNSVPAAAIDTQTGIKPNRPAVTNNGTAATSDQVVLSPLAAAAASGASPRLAAIKAAVDAGTYEPPSLAVASKLVSGALARMG